MAFGRKRMFDKKIILSGLLISSMILFSGCIKYYKLSKTETPQGKDHPDHREVVFDNVRSQTVNEQFETLAKFDALRLSDEVRKTYVEINAEKRGRDEQSKQALLRRQLEENKHWISFYVLADVRDKTHISLTDKNSLWSLYLKFGDGQKVTPISVKEIDLEPEYQFLFGHRFTHFKRSYEVKFPAVDLTGKAYSQENTDFKLVISSPSKECELTWGDGVGLYREGKRKYKDEDYYWI